MKARAFTANPDFILPPLSFIMLYGGVAKW
jgi:hypothetical protein